MTLAEQVCALPEIEFAELMEVIADHVHKNKLDHVIERSLGPFNNLRDEINDLEEERDNLLDEVEKGREAVKLIEKLKQIIIK